MFFQHRKSLKVCGSITPHPIDNRFTPHRRAQHFLRNGANEICYNIGPHSRFHTFSIFRSVKYLKKYFVSSWSGQGLTPGGCWVCPKNFIQIGWELAAGHSLKVQILYRFSSDNRSSYPVAVGSISTASKFTIKWTLCPFYYAPASCLREKSLIFCVVNFWQFFFIFIQFHQRLIALWYSVSKKNFIRIRWKLAVWRWLEHIILKKLWSSWHW